jgi:hypothetical protein
LDGVIEWLVSAVELRDVLVLCGYLLAGGVLGIHTRFLYRRYARTLSNREGFSAVFPLLTLAVILVIFVVKSSLALSLGLVGALSIVRFRAAIKEPEEIVYLFFCIAVGLALGAEYLSLAIAATVVFTGFVVGAERLRRGGAGEGALLLTISGTPGPDERDAPATISALLGEVIGPFRVQRLDVDDGQLQLRAVVTTETAAGIASAVAQLQTRLPGYRISYVDLENLL